MNWSGWLFMGVSWTVIIGVLAFAMGRTLRQHQPAEPDDPPSSPTTD